MEPTHLEDLIKLKVEIIMTTIRKFYPSIEETRSKDMNNKVNCEISSR